MITFQRVLDLIKSKNVDLTVIAGDTSYNKSRDAEWDSRVRNTLGNSDPGLVAIGNHELQDSIWADVKKYGENRLKNSVLNGKCSGNYGEKMTCEYENVYIIISGVGTIGNRTDHENYIKSKLASAPKGKWIVCVWHKNQRNMQLGDKGDEVGWTAYEECRKAGAIIMTGHEHSYSRTHLLSSAQNQTVADSSSPYTLEKGRTVVVVTGLGGVSIRPETRGGAWWAKKYTSTQNAKHGSLFGTFGPTTADFEFINIDGQVIDSYQLRMGDSLK